VRFRFDRVSGSPRWLDRMAEQPGHVLMDERPAEAA
jgi:hypothetical protein